MESAVQTKMQQKKNRSFKSHPFWRDRYLYLLLVPVIIYYIIFKYLPMAGIVMAFKDYKFSSGIFGSPWVGLKHFQGLMHSQDFFLVFRNTILLNIYSLVFGFPIPIVLAILFNEIRSTWYRRTLQQVIYLPHFFSWIILGGMVINILSPRAGAVNAILEHITGQKIFFMANNFWWPVMFVISGIWKEAGWGTIIYLAGISGIDPELYEASIIDGANKWKQITHITLPCLSSTIVITLILRMGSMMDVGFEQVFMLQNNAVIKVADVISTYVYRMGVAGYQYSATTAIGIFQSVIGLLLIMSANKLARKYSGSGIW